MTDAPAKAHFRIFRTASFARDFKALPKDIQQRAEKALARLIQSPSYPSLRAKKMKGAEGVWEASITMSYRLTYHLAGDTITLRRIGTHAILQEEARRGK